jgi:hypothetical protein
MLNVIGNNNTNGLQNVANAYVGVVLAKKENVVVSVGNNKKMVYEDAYVEWAVKWNYEGNILILPADEIKVIN